ncbi:helix-turn-helix domain-containing protein [Candidatus Endomicrobiellum trichonymphae]|uniref:helix-turn-helix domain-containing protein n=1 Tax=Endomicrobium trichonymphae TaxID=1408204 RepID=UPI0039B9D0E3
MRRCSEKIGELLKEKRGKMNISFADIYKATKIREKYISAIEDGDMSIFSRQFIIEVLCGRTLNI